MFYFNSMYKFWTSFYNIFNNARLDESDIAMIEITAAFVFAVMVAGYSVAYMTVLWTEDNKYYGPMCLISSLGVIV